MLHKFPVFFRSQRHKGLYGLILLVFGIPCLILHISGSDIYDYEFLTFGFIIWIFFGSYTLLILDYIVQLFNVIINKKPWGNGFL